MHIQIYYTFLITFINMCNIFEKYQTNAATKQKKLTLFYIVFLKVIKFFFA